MGVDDLALRRSHFCATVLINAEKRHRVVVLPDRRSSTLAAWLREHPGVEAVCRDGANGYADAVYSGCWASAPRARDRPGRSDQDTACVGERMNCTGFVSH
ncbi:hypothetical protein E1285_22180 [Actinomadura sp. 7K507]|nr:hypothetical protein E1285_22180 [Actinomadura sp. 7K507]